MTKFTKVQLGIVVLIVLLAVLICAPASAIMVPLTTSELADNSTNILRAQVVDKQSRFNERRNYIFTDVTLQITEQYKGTLKEQSITVRVPGGEVGDRGLKVEHAAVFNVGEDVIVFLEKKGAIFDVTGWQQGKYTIVAGMVKEKELPVATFVSAVKDAIK